MNYDKYIVHKQGGYLYTLSKVVEEALDMPCVHSSNPNEPGIWVLFVSSFISGFYKSMKHPYVVVHTEPSTFGAGKPDYENFCKNALKILDYQENLQLRYSNQYRLEKEESKEIDVLFYGSLSHRRKTIIDKIGAQNKVVLCTSPPVAGPALWKYISNSKIVLDINNLSNTSSYFDWVRLAPLLSNNVFTITELSTNPVVDEMKKCMIFCEYDEIPERVEYFLKNPIERVKWADLGFDYIRKHKTSIDF